MPQYIEFVGVPGSGKTTVYRRFLDLLKRQNERAYTLDEAAYHALRHAISNVSLKMLINVLPYRLGSRFISRFPRTPDDIFYVKFHKFLLQHQELSTIVHRYQIKSSENTQDLGLLVFLWLFELFSRYQLVTDELHDDSFVLVDEGFSQRVMTLFAYDCQGNVQSIKKNIEAYIDSIPLPDRVVLLDTSPEVVEERMRKRGYPLRMRMMTDSERTALLEHATFCMETAVHRLQQKHVEIAHLDNNVSESELIAQIQKENSRMRN